MNALGAMIFMTREDPEQPPILLKELLFSPAIVWSIQALKHAGVTDFLVICHQPDLETITACVPSDVTVVVQSTPESQSAADALFECQQVLVLTKPLLLGNNGLHFVPIGTQQQVDNGMYRLTGFAAADALKQNMGFDDVLTYLGEPANETCALPLEGTHPNLWRIYQSHAQALEINRLEMAGARFIDPASCFTDPTVTIGKDTVLYPGTILKGNTTIGEGCQIGPNAMITHCTIGDGVTVNSSQLNQSTVDSGSTIGPFAYVRPHCHIGADVKVGDFVELKNSNIGDGTKISHLTYIGDSDVGKNVNFGCGTVTVNYDGANKFRTTIEDDAFIGCNTNLIAPVTVEKGGFTAAGSTITNTVPSNGLSIARANQVNKENWTKPTK